MVEVPRGHLFLGGTVDPSTHERTGEPLLLDSADLTTHGVIVGMTGSGKTGLGICLVEEALLQGIPALVIDPKGDMGNLLLTFPDLEPGEFEPWIDPVVAAQAGREVADLAAEAASRWRSGLSSWGIEPHRIAELRARAELSVFTPGSGAGAPLNVLGSLDPPTTGDAELVHDEVEGVVSGLLGLVGIAGDPLSSREHILLSNLVTSAWTAGRGMDLPTLVAQVQQPPMRKLGVIDLESFYPAADRARLAVMLNGLLASPAFATWLTGPPLDIGRLLWAPDGRPRGAIVSIAHLDDEQRQFVVTLLASKLVTWMRSQSGTSGLRVLVYMDEVFGFVPPVAAPPAKKPLLTILKQARAFGVGLVLATQNPVDLDYKALSNAGTWMIGRLQTERDRSRLLDGLASASGAVDISAVGETIAGLAAREFVLHSTHRHGPELFTTRWAMSYLAGPLTREQIGRLVATRTAAEPGSDAAGDRSTASAPPTAVVAGETTAADESSVMPRVADGVKVWYLDPAAPWAPRVGAVAGGTRLEPALVTRVRLLFADARAGIHHDAEWEAVVHPLTDPVAADHLLDVDYDDRDFLAEPPSGARYVLPEARIHTKTFFSAAHRMIRDHVHRTGTLEVFHNPAVKLYSRPGESRDAFVARCREAADARADAEADALRRSLGAKLDRIRNAIAVADDRVREADRDASTRSREEMVSGVGDVLGSLLGGRSSVSGMMGSVRRAGSRRRMRERADERLATARNRLEEKLDDQAALEQELADTLAAIHDTWSERATTIEEAVIRPRKTDITVDAVALVWIPTE